MVQCELLGPYCEHLGLPIRTLSSVLKRCQGTAVQEKVSQVCTASRQQTDNVELVNVPTRVGQ